MPRLATEEEGKAIFAEVDQWFRDTKSSVMWGNGITPSRGTIAARTAIAEYIASQRGLTLYAHFADDSNG